MKIYQISNNRVGLLTENGTRETLQTLVNGLEQLAKVCTHADVMHGIDTVYIYDFESHHTVLGYQWEIL